MTNLIYRQIALFLALSIVFSYFPTTVFGILLEDNSFYEETNLPRKPYAYFNYNTTHPLTTEIFSEQIITQGTFSGVTFGDEMINGAPWRLYNNGLLVVEGGHINSSLDLPLLNAPSGWRSHANNIKQIVFTDTIIATDLMGLFQNLYNLTTIDGLSNINTDRTISMDRIFYRAGNLKSLDLSSFVTGGMIFFGANHAFTGTYLLRELTLGTGFGFISGAGTGLSPVPSNEYFTGFWQNVCTGTTYNPEGIHTFTSIELMANFDGRTMSDTWVWQRATFDINGRVVSSNISNYSPISNAVIELLDANGMPFVPAKLTTTSVDGTFAFSNVPREQNYRISVLAEGFQTGHTYIYNLTSDYNTHDIVLGMLEGIISIEPKNTIEANFPSTTEYIEMLISVRVCNDWLAMFDAGNPEDRIMLRINDEVLQPVNLSDQGFWFDFEDSSIAFITALLQITPNTTAYDIGKNIEVYFQATTESGFLSTGISTTLIIHHPIWVTQFNILNPLKSTNNVIFPSLMTEPLKYEAIVNLEATFDDANWRLYLIDQGIEEKDILNYFSNRIYYDIPLTIGKLVSNKLSTTTFKLDPLNFIDIGSNTTLLLVAYPTDTEIYNGNNRRDELMVSTPIIISYNPTSDIFMMPPRVFRGSINDEITLRFISPQHNELIAQGIRYELHVWTLIPGQYDIEYYLVHEDPIYHRAGIDQRIVSIETSQNIFNISERTEDGTGYAPRYIAYISFIDEHDIMSGDYALLIIEPPTLNFSFNDDFERVFRSDQLNDITISWVADGILPGSDILIEITRNGELVLRKKQASNTNSFTFRPSQMTKHVYYIYQINITITGVGKNNTLTSTTGLEVFNSDSLRINMSNNHLHNSVILDFANMSSDDILALNRQINLSSLVQLYNPSNWPASESMEWSISNRNSIGLHKRVGNQWHNIEDMGISSFHPTTNFKAIGVLNGNAYITVTHSRTGINYTINVDVNSLHNQLYLITVIPRMRTLVNFTNGLGETFNLYTNDNGEIAIYEPHSIIGEIRFKSTQGDNLLLGSVHSSSLVTGEPDNNSIQIYPMNIVQLRSVSNQTFFVYLPDGSPYPENSRVAVSGVLFQNGELVEKSLYNNIHSVRSGGAFTINMDSASWDIELGDHLEFHYEIRFLDADLAPLVVSIDGFTNNNHNISVGDTILRPISWNGRGFVAIQYLYKDEFDIFDVTQLTSFVSTNINSPTGELHATIVATQNTDMANIRFVDQFGTTPSTQRLRPIWQDNTFLSGYYTFWELTLPINDALQLQPGEHRGFAIYGNDINGSTHRLDLPFRVFNGSDLMIPEQYLNFDFDISDILTDNSIFSSIFGEDNTDVALQLINSIVTTSVELPRNLSFITHVARDSSNPLVFTISGVYAGNWPRAGKWSYTLAYPYLNFPSKPNIPIPPTRPRRPAPPMVYWSTTIGHYTIHTRYDCYLLRKSTGYNSNHGSFIVRSPLYLDIYDDFTNNWNHSAPINSIRCQNDDCDWVEFDTNRAKWRLIIEAQNAEYTEARLSFEEDRKIFDQLNEQFNTKFERALRREQQAINKPHTAIFNANTNASGYFIATLTWNIYTSSFQFEFIQAGINLEVRATSNTRFTRRIPILDVPVSGVYITIEFNAGVGANIHAVIDMSYDTNNQEQLIISADTNGYIRFRGATDTDIWVAATNIDSFGKFNLDAEFISQVLVPNVASRWNNLYAIAGIDNIWRVGPHISILDHRLYREGTTRIWEAQENHNNTPMFGNQSLFNQSSHSRTLEADLDDNYFTLINSLFQQQLYNIPISMLPAKDPVIAGNSNIAFATWSSLYGLEQLYDLIITDYINDIYFYDNYEYSENLKLEILDSIEFDIINLANMTEIIVSIYRNGTWSTPKYLTNNHVPDMEPIVRVCVNTQQAVVVWQQRDFYENSKYFGIGSLRLWYSVYSNNNWSQPNRINIGIDGRILDYSVAINGSDIALAIFIYDDTAYDATDGIFIVHIDTNTNTSTQNRITHNANINMNPQIVPFGNDFIFAYYSDDFEGNIDIVLGRLMSNRQIDPNFSKSIGATASLVGIDLSMRYVLVSNNETLSIAWSHYDSSVDGDSLYASILTNNDGIFSISTPMLLTPATEGIMMDIVDGVLDSSNNIHILYKITHFNDFMFTEGVYRVAKNQFVNNFEYHLLISDSDIVPEINLPLELFMLNTGIDTISQITISINNVNTIWDNLKILPGDTFSDIIIKTLGMDIVNLSYNVYVYFSDIPQVSNNVLNIARPDISFGRFIVTGSHLGIRKFAMSLHNLSHIRLEGSGYHVHLHFYRDPMHSIPIDVMGDLVISDNARLALIDEGGLSLTYRYTITYQDLDYDGEIQYNGIRLFARVEIRDADGNIVEEIDYTANRGNILLERILPYGQNSVIVQAKYFDGISTDLDIINRSMQDIPSNIKRLIALLLDENGNMLEAYTSIIPILQREDTLSHQVSFSQVGYSIVTSVEYIGTSSSLSSLNLSGIPFEFDGNTYIKIINIHNIAISNLIAIAENPEATIFVNDIEFDDIAIITIPLADEITYIEIVVSVGSLSTTYIVSIFTEELSLFLPHILDTPDIPEELHTPPVIISENNAKITYGESYMFQVVVGSGTEPITFGLSNEPSSITINYITGLLTIEPTTKMGIHNFNILASGVAPPIYTQNFILHVVPIVAPPDDDSNDVIDDDSSNVVDPDHEISMTYLSTPIGLEIVNTIISWEVVSNALGYRIYVDNQVQIDLITETNFDLNMLDLPYGTHIIRIRAIGDNIRFRNSSPSAIKNFEVEELQSSALVINLYPDYQNHVYNSLDENDAVLPLFKDENIMSFRFCRDTLNLIKESRIPLRIVNNLVTLEMNDIFISELLRNMKYDNCELIINIREIYSYNIYMASYKNDFIRTEITFTICENKLQEFTAYYTIFIDLSKFDLSILNHYRISAIYDERIVGGSLDLQIKLFAINTNMAGKFSIEYVETLSRLSMKINSCIIVDLANNAPTQAMDVLPLIKNNYVLLPVRFIAYALGAKVSWIPRTEDTPLVVIITLDGETLKFSVGKTVQELEASDISVQAQIINDRTMVPFRFVSEFFGALVNWNEKTQNIEILRDTKDL